MDYLRRVSVLALAALGVAACGGPTAPDTTNPDTTNPTPIAPTLIAPGEGAILDNGCSNGTRDLVTWDFEWSAVPRASRYHLVIWGPKAAKALVDDATITVPRYREATVGYVAYLTGWQWKVRAEVDGAFGPFSATRSFGVEDVNTDCP